jgi:hypothetical protein
MEAMYELFEEENRLAIEYLETRPQKLRLICIICGELLMKEHRCLEDDLCIICKRVDCTCSLSEYEPYLTRKHIVNPYINKCELCGTIDLDHDCKGCLTCGLWELNHSCKEVLDALVREH